jgi:hypothetical protein
MAGIYDLNKQSNVVSSILLPEKVRKLCFCGCKGMNAFSISNICLWYAMNLVTPNDGVKA